MYLYSERICWLVIRQFIACQTLTFLKLQIYFIVCTFVERICLLVIRQFIARQKNFLHCITLSLPDTDNGTCPPCGFNEYCSCGTGFECKCNEVVDRVCVGLYDVQHYITSLHMWCVGIIFITCITQSLKTVMTLLRHLATYSILECCYVYNTLLTYVSLFFVLLNTHNMSTLNMCTAYISHTVLLIQLTIVI